MKRELEGIIDNLGRRSGKDFSRFNETFLTKSVKQRMAVLALPTAAAYLRYLEAHGAETEVLVETLTITFSEFFRDPLALALLEQMVLPGVFEKKTGGGEIRVWSAGCAAGQEPYSLALLLDGLAAKRKPPGSWRIFATDTSEADLVRARQGVYDYSAVRKVPLQFIRTYFRQDGETYTVVPELRDRLSFSRYDLLDRHSASPPESIYGSFDLVSCSNLLFYYRPSSQRDILIKIGRALSSGGILVTGEAERSIVERVGGFEAVAPPAGVYRKGGG